VPFPDVALDKYFTVSKFLNPGN